MIFIIYYFLTFTADYYNESFVIYYLKKRSLKKVNNSHFCIITKNNNSRHLRLRRL